MDRAGDVSLAVFLVRADIEQHHAFLLIKLPGADLLDPQSAQEPEQLDQMQEYDDDAYQNR